MFFIGLMRINLPFFGYTVKAFNTANFTSVDLNVAKRIVNVRFTNF